MEFMDQAVEQSFYAIRNGIGGPFGAVIVKDGKVVGKCGNRVTSTNDPTAHAEVMAIRDACKNLQTFVLKGCVIYTSCQPCPMCLAAIYWAHLDKVFYANTKEDAADIGFDDKFIYEEFAKEMGERRLAFEKMSNEKAIGAFKEYHDKKGQMY